jgi:hypothetical protein
MMTIFMNIRLLGQPLDEETQVEALISPSMEDGAREGTAIVRCAALFNEDRKIYGADLRQALRLAERLVKDVWRDRNIRLVRRELISRPKE